MKRVQCGGLRRLAIVASMSSALAMPLFVGELAHAGGDGLRVLDGTWTDAVHHRSHALRYEGVAPSGSLYFWTKISGTADDIDTLRRERRLPIYHKWFHNEAGVYRADGDADAFQAPALEVPLEVGSADTVEPLAREVSDRGYFDWRTWSVKTVAPGRWIVRIVDARNDVLRCGQRDCEYRIRVK